MNKSTGITCPRYEALQGGKRCKHYLPNGACSLPDELMCREWLRSNGHPVTLDLFGNRISEPIRKDTRQRAATDGKPVAIVEPMIVIEQPDSPRRGLTAEDIESFKALNAEFCIRTDGGDDIWLVSAYTDQSRKEIAPEHVELVSRLLDIFPGSRIVAFNRVSE